MSRTRRIIKWLGIVLVTLCLLLVLFFYHGVPYVLRNVGINFSSYNYDFPAQIELTDYDMDFGRIQASGKYLKVNWDWISLTSGNPTLTSLNIDEIAFYLNPKDTTLPEKEKKKGGGLPNFIIQDAHLNKVKLGFVGNYDSSFYDLEAFYVNHYQMGDSIFVDSLLLSGVDARLHFTNDKPEQDPKPLPDNILATMPDFYGNYVHFNQSSLTLYNARQTHALSNVNFTLSTSKSNEYGSLGLDQLQLTYQDTLDIDLDIANAGIDPKLNTGIRDLELDLPGVKLKLDEVSIANNDGVQITTKIGSSYVSYGLLSSFVKLPEELPRTSTVQFEGSVGYLNNVAVVEDFKLSTLQHTGIALDATANFEDKENPAFDVQVHRLYSTMNDIVLLTEKPTLKKQFKVRNIDVPLNLEGDLENFTLTCSINADEVSIPVLLKARQLRPFDYQYTFKTSIDTLALEELMYSPPASVAINKLDIEAYGEFNKENPIKRLKTSLQTHDVYYDHHHFTDLRLMYDNHSPTDSLTLRLKKQRSALNFRAMYTKNELDELTIDGDITYYFPKPTKNKGDSLCYTSSIASNVVWNTEKELIKGDFRLNNGVLSDTATSYDLGNTIVQFVKDKNAINAALKSGRLLDFEFESIFSMEDQLSAFDKIEELDANLSMNIDSNLVLLVADVKSGMDMKSLHINKQKDRINIEGNINEAYFNKLFINNLKVDVIKENKQKPFVGALEIGEVLTSVTNLEDLYCRVEEISNGYKLKMGTEISTTKSSIDWSFDLLEENDNLRLHVDNEDRMVFGESVWQGLDFPGILLTPSFEPIRGQIAINNQHQTVGIQVLEKEKSIEAVIKNLDLYPVFQNLDSTFSISGIFGAKLEYKIPQKLLSWKSRVSNIYLDSNYVGNLTLDGQMSRGVIINDLRIDHKDSYLTANSWIKGKNIDYHVVAKDFDINYLNEAPFWPEGLNLMGVIDTDIKGNYGSFNTSEGYVVLKDFQYSMGTNYPTYLIKNDSITIKDYELFLHNFYIYDDDNNKMAINGSVNLLPIDYYLTVRSDEFRVLRAINPDEYLHGDINLMYDLKLIGSKEFADITGELGIKGGGELTYTVGNQYKYKHDDQSTVIFSDFEEDDINKLKENEKDDFELNLDVHVGIGKTAFKVIINEITQEFVLMYGKGDLQLKDGLHNEVMVFGAFEANKGRAFIKPPIIPDMDMDIDWATLRWKGKYDNPYISFRGREHFRASPSGLMTEYYNSTHKEDFDVILNVQESTLQDLKITFDLSSRNGKIDEYLQSQPRENRQSYAINLLLLGSFEANVGGGGNGANTYYNMATSKLNEISRRNLKGVDLSFSVEDEKNPYDELDHNTNISYRLSKAFMNNRAFITIGGDYGMTESNTNESDASRLASFFEINYILKERPYIVAHASRGQEYEGVIDGEVDVIKTGVSIEKSYPSFLYIFGFRKKGR